MTNQAQATGLVGVASAWSSRPLKNATDGDNVRVCGEREYSDSEVSGGCDRPTTCLRRAVRSGSDSGMTSESEDNSSFCRRRSLASIFSSLGKGGKQKTVTSPNRPRRKVCDKTKSQFYVDLPSDTTLSDIHTNSNHAHYTHTQLSTSEGGREREWQPQARQSKSLHREWRVRGTYQEVQPTTSGLHTEHQVKPKPTGWRSKTQLGVLVTAEESLRESPVYRQRAFLAQHDNSRHDDTDSTMGLGFSSNKGLHEATGHDEAQTDLNTHTVAANVTQHYVSVLAELTQKYTSLLSAPRFSCDAHIRHSQPIHTDDREATRKECVLEDDQYGNPGQQQAWSATWRSSVLGKTVDGVEYGIPVEYGVPVEHDIPIEHSALLKLSVPVEYGDWLLISPPDTPHKNFDGSEDINVKFCEQGLENDGLTSVETRVYSERTYSDQCKGDSELTPDQCSGDNERTRGDERRDSESDDARGMKHSEAEREAKEGPEVLSEHSASQLLPSAVREVLYEACERVSEEGSVGGDVLCPGGGVREGEGGRSDLDTCPSPGGDVTHVSTNLLTASPDLTPTASPDLTSQDKRDRKIFLIAQEVMTSERVFVDVLKLLNVDFRQFVCEWQEVGCSHHPPLPLEDLNKILNYLPQLQNLNEEILADLEARIADWETHKKISDVIVRKGPFLKLYSAYIKEFENQCEHIDYCCDAYPAFGRALKRFEASKRCNKLQIKHYMLKPVQRIPQYRLLFEEYLKCLSESSPDYVDTQTALAVVANVAAHANATMKQGNNFMKLLALQDRLSSSSSGDHDSSSSRGPRCELVRPGRYLLKEGELLKLCRREMQPRYFILLSDVLLYTSFVTSGPGGALRLNYELTLEGMKVETPKAEEFKNEFSVISTSRSFTLQASTAEERDEWIVALREAIEDNASRRSTFLQAKTFVYRQPSTSTLGKQAPVWIPDYRVTMCQQCTAEFTLTFRRHHCRACGKVVCDHCSANRAPLQYKKNQTARVCDTCFEILQKDFEHRYEGSAVQEDQQGDKIRRVSSLKAQFKKGIRESSRNRIKKRVPERLMEVCASDASSQMCGYLRMMVRRSWHRGWFVLKDRVLYEYRAPQDVCALQSLPVLGYIVEAMQKVASLTPSLSCQRHASPTV